MHTTSNYRMLQDVTGSHVGKVQVVDGSHMWPVESAELGARGERVWFGDGVSVGPFFSQQLPGLRDLSSSGTWVGTSVPGKPALQKSGSGKLGDLASFVGRSQLWLRKVRVLGNLRGWLVEDIKTTRPKQLHTEPRAAAVFGHESVASVSLQAMRVWA